MDNPRPSVPPAAVETLRRTVDGVVAYPTDPAYDALLADHPDLGVRPDVVVVPACEAAVRAAVDVARTYGFQVLSPHGGPRTAPGTGAGPVMRVLTHRLSDVVVDPVTCTATVGPAATWTDLAAHARAAQLGVPVPAVLATTVLDSVMAGAKLVSARVVRSDGFVHLVDEIRPPGAGLAAWVLTAVVVQLNRIDSTTIGTSEDTLPLLGANSG